MFCLRPLDQGSCNIILGLEMLPTVSNRGLPPTTMAGPRLVPDNQVSRLWIKRSSLCSTAEQQEQPAVKGSHQCRSITAHVHWFGTLPRLSLDLLFYLQETVGCRIRI